MNVIQIKREPVYYSIDVVAYYDGQESDFVINGLGSPPNQRSRDAIVADLELLITLVKGKP